jgi:hypothetical protein
MVKKNALKMLAGASVMLLGSQAMAVITLNNGNAVYVTTAPTTATGTGLGTADFRPDNVAGLIGDRMTTNTWFWRINGVDTREFQFSSAAGFGFTEAGSGTSTGTRSWTGLGGGAFNALQTITLTDGANAGEAVVVQTMQITNLTNNPLDISLFHHSDLDLNGTFGGDSAILLSSDTIQNTDGPQGLVWQGTGANAYQVAAFNTLAPLHTNAVVDNLNNSGLPFGPGDFTGSFQWNNVIAAGGSITVTSIYTAYNVPGPAGLALLGLAGLVGSRRRR